MRRRAFMGLLVGAASSLGRAAVGLPFDRPRRIGFLRASPPPEGVLDAFRHGLAENGLVERRDYTIVVSWGEGTPARLPGLAAALVKAGVDVIVADGTRPAAIARDASATIPVVMAGGLDPTAYGLVRNLSRPGGNVTGFTTQVTDLVGKSFQILRELVPGLKRIAIFAPPGTGSVFRRADAAAAQAQGLTIDYITVDPSKPRDVDAAMRQAVSAGAQSGIMRGTPFLSTAQRRTLVERSAAARLPMMYETGHFVALGGLIAYGTDFNELFRLAAGYVVKILRGASAATLPVQQSTRIELVINLRAARKLGLTVPRPLLLRADAVIE